jgi:hypothetical protein
MSFNLEITITGMCLYVPDVEKRLLHVLLVRYDGHHSNGHHADCPDRHFARLVYDKAYLDEEASHLSGGMSCDDLTRCALLLDGFDDALKLDLPDQIVDLNEIAPGGNLEPNCVRNNPPPTVAARVTLGAGSITDWEQGDIWYPSSSPEGRITTAVDWTISNIQDEALRLDILNLDDETQVRRQLILHPKNNFVKLYIYNATIDGLPPAEEKDPQAINKDQPAKHFDGYYQLYQGAPHVIPVRAKQGNPPKRDPIQRCDCKRVSAMLSAYTSNCVHAKV